MSAAARSLRPHIVMFATKGAGTNEERRMRDLLAPFEPEVFAFERRTKRAMFVRLVRHLWRGPCDLVVMEGTGIAGGLALLLARTLRGVDYVVSTGDAVAPFLASRVPWLRPAFALYERLLYRYSAGVIGWTPYLAGRALTLGAPRAMTAPGWAPFAQDAGARERARAKIRARHGIPEDAIVVGIAGALVWNPRVAYAYGAELVHALGHTKRDDVRALIVGDGTGRAHLERLAGDVSGARVIFTGNVSQSDVADHLAAMDIGSLPQSVDGVGSFRYTTKLSEYLAAALPVVTGQIPLAYDLDDGWLWRLPGRAPWDARYVDALAALLESVTPAAIASRRAATAGALREFELPRQVARVTAFVEDLLAARRA